MSQNLIVGLVVPVASEPYATNRPPHLQGQLSVLQVALVREAALKDKLASLLKAATDVLDLHEDEPDRPAVRILRETCANVQR